MADRLALLGRLERLRAIERQEALTRLAEKRAELRRMEELAHRSRTLAGEGVVVGDESDGAALAAMLVFHGRLASLVGDAEQLGKRTSAAEARARAGFAEADRRLERVRERRHRTDRLAVDRQMARSLLNSGHKPRGPL